MFQRRRFNEHDRAFVLQYVNKYNCTIAEAIADRDEPMLLEELVEWFTVTALRAPTPEEISIMRPNSMRAIQEQIAHYRE